MTPSQPQTMNGNESHSDDENAALREDHENESETNDDRPAAEEARDLAESLVEERTEVKTRPTWEGTRTVGIDRPAAREVAEDVADRVQGATVYTEEESQILTRNGGPDGREVLDTVYEVAVIDLGDREVAIYPGGQDVELRDADNGGDVQ